MTYKKYVKNRTKKVYKIKQKSTGKYISMGYRNKSTWLIFPYDAVHGLDPNDHVVDVFELVKTTTLNTKNEEISDAN